jgi:hypothetical protein
MLELQMGVSAKEKMNLENLLYYFRQGRQPGLNNATAKRLFTSLVFIIRTLNFVYESCNCLLQKK